MKWVTSFATDEAATEVAFLFQDEDIKAEILRILAILADEQDPRSPRPSTGLLVAEVEFDSPHWFRVKILRYGIRIVFRLLIFQEDELRELKASEKLPDGIEEAFIEIMQANYRKDVYGEELRRRYRKYHLDEPDTE
jgi:hypothetical protein